MEKMMDSLFLSCFLHGCWAVCCDSSQLASNVLSRLTAYEVGKEEFEGGINRLKVAYYGSYQQAWQIRQIQSFYKYGK